MEKAKKKLTYSVIEGKENCTIMCKVGKFFLKDNISQSKLKALYNFGYTDLIKLG
jgi:hypothetical protein